MVPDRIFVIGFLGSSAEDVGAALAEKLERPLFRLEQVIESGARVPIQELYKREGESGLRQRERRALVSVATGPPSVVSTGPGAFCERGNQRTVAQAGISVVVDATLEECLQGAIERNLFKPGADSNERFATLYESRRAEYEAADVIIEKAGRDAETIADEVLQRLEDRVWEEKLA